MTRIMVIDDDADIRDLVRHRLTIMGIEVETHADGQSGLQAVIANPPDLAIVDMMMPRMNGLEVTRAIRTHPATRHVPVVIFTGLESSEYVDAVREAGTEYYVVKPFSVLALGAYVEKVLGLRKCIVCARPRGVDDVGQAAESAWTVTADGDICPDCRAASAPAKPRLLTL